MFYNNTALLSYSDSERRTNNERKSIEESYRRLECKRAEALIGWYAFKGTDNTDKGVLSHFKAFMQADDEILDPLQHLDKLRTYHLISLIKWSGICVYYTELET